jgi:hypothetical protein
MGILSNIFNAPVYVNSVLAIRSNPISPAQAALPSSVALGAAYQGTFLFAFLALVCLSRPRMAC